MPRPEERALLNWVRPGDRPDWEELRGLDRNRLARLLDVQRVGPWLYRKWKNHPGADASFEEELKQLALRSTVITELDRRVRVEVLGAMAGKGIRPIPLKGTVLGTWLYGDPELRPCHDLDVLVEPRQNARAQEILASIGYREAVRNATPWLNRMSHEQAFWRGDDLPVELHRHITQPRRYSVSLHGLLERSVPWSWEQLQLRRLSDEDQFLHLTIHAAHHQFLIPLIHWVDLALLIRKGIDIEVVARRAEKARATVALQIAGSNLQILMGDHTVLSIAGRLGVGKAVALGGLQKGTLAESDTRGSLRDRWHAFWLIERLVDRLLLTLGYTLRWWLDRPIVLMTYLTYRSRQFRSKSGWRSMRLPLGAGLSNLSAGRRGSPHAPQ